MPKYRKLYVKTTESLDINDMPDDFTRLMWVLMPLGLCREGRGIDNPAWLKSKLFPLRTDVTQEMISTAMEWYEQRGMIRRYQINGRSYFYLPTFKTYQGKTDREAESDYPPPPDESTTHSRPTHDPLTTSSSSDSLFNIQYSDADADSSPQRAATDELTTPDALVVFEEQYGPFKQDIDREAIQGAVCQHGDQIVIRAIQWLKGRKSSNVIQAILTAADKFARGPPPSDNGRGDRSSNATLQAIEELEAEVNGGFG